MGPTRQFRPRPNSLLCLLLRVFLPLLPDAAAAAVVGMGVAAAFLVAVTSAICTDTCESSEWRRDSTDTLRNKCAVFFHMDTAHNTKYTAHILNRELSGCKQTIEENYQRFREKTNDSKTIPNLGSRWSTINMIMQKNYSSHFGTCKNYEQLKLFTRSSCYTQNLDYILATLRPIYKMGVPLYYSNWHYIFSQYIYTNFELFCIISIFFLHKMPCIS